MPSAKRRPSWKRFLGESQSTRRKLEGLLRDARTLASDSDGDVPNSALALRREYDQWKDLSQAAVSELAACVEASAKVEAQYQEELPDRLRRLLAAGGHSVHGEASLIVLEGVVHIQFDAGKPAVRINDVAQPDLSLAALATAAVAEVDRLRGSTSEPLEFLELMLRAYRVVLSTTGRTFGSQVATLDLLPHLLLAKQSVPFLENPRDATFRAYDLPTYRADIINVLDLPRGRRGEGRTFHWAAGSDTKGAVFMLVPSMRRTAYVGRIWFG